MAPQDDEPSDDPQTTDRPSTSRGTELPPSLEATAPVGPLPKWAAADPGTRSRTVAGGSDHVGAHLAKGSRRDAATIWRANPRDQGLLGLTDAIGWFGQQGSSVSIPLIDSQPYDLIVDDGAGLRRVQVKTTTRRSARGHFLVQVCTRGGNQSFHTTKYFDPSACDLLYVLTDADSRYLMPAQAVTARTTLTLNDRFDPFRVERR